MKDLLDSKSKNLAFLLRHDKSYNFPKPDGWREVSDLIRNHGFTRRELDEIVSTDKKGRYEFDQVKNRIRALQGHSIPGIEPDITELLPPPILYHGTSSRFINSILKLGILKQSRNHVHLSADIDTARNVGMRHGGSVVILKINTESMVKDGIKFWKSRNGVWLSKDIEPKYFEIYYETSRGEDI